MERRWTAAGRLSRVVLFYCSLLCELHRYKMQEAVNTCDARLVRRLPEDLGHTAVFTLCNVEGVIMCRVCHNIQFCLI